MKIVLFDLMDTILIDPYKGVFKSLFRSPELLRNFFTA